MRSVKNGVNGVPDRSGEQTTITNSGVDQNTQQTVVINPSSQRPVVRGASATIQDMFDMNAEDFKTYREKLRTLGVDVTETGKLPTATGYKPHELSEDDFIDGSKLLKGRDSEGAETSLSSFDIDGELTKSPNPGVDQNTRQTVVLNPANIRPYDGPQLSEDDFLDMSKLSKGRDGKGEVLTSAEFPDEFRMEFPPESKGVTPMPDRPTPRLSSRFDRAIEGINAPSEQTTAENSVSGPDVD